MGYFKKYVKLKGRILRYARMGHPVLERRALDIDDPTSPDTKQLAIDMIETLKENGGTGLAAPQVYVPKRLFVYHLPKMNENPFYSRLSQDEKDGLGWQIVVNPILTPLDDEKILGWEGCLSVPGMVGEVARFKSVEIKAFNLEGEPVTIQAHNFHARVLQHEYDHLEGILYPMRIENMARFGFREEILKFHVQANDIIDDDEE